LGFDGAAERHRHPRSSISIRCNIKASFQAVPGRWLLASSYGGGYDGQGETGQRDGGAN
jgi:hypothetical protein